MTKGASRSPLERLRIEQLSGASLVAFAIIVWAAGAFYCSGYERLLSGIDNWPGSLAWSAVAVLPWLALFEWSKSRSGRRILASPASLAAMLVATAALSLTIGRLTDWADGHSTPLALALLRRLPAAGISLVLILWSRTGPRGRARDERDASLASLAGSIDWVEAADNYVELHIAGRTLMRRMTMQQAERALGGFGFVRIHRRFLVNARKIRSIEGTNGERVVRLADGIELPVGRSFAANLSRAA